MEFENFTRLIIEIGLLVSAPAFQTDRFATNVLYCVLFQRFCQGGTKIFQRSECMFVTVDGRAYVYRDDAQKHPRGEENPEIKTIRDAHRMRGHFSML